jgi:hypothetical protein
MLIIMSRTLAGFTKVPCMLAPQYHKWPLLADPSSSVALSSPPPLQLNWPASCLLLPAPGLPLACPSPQSTWDAKQSEAAQRAKDEQVQEVLTVLLDALISELGSSMAADALAEAAGARPAVAAAEAPIGDRAAAAAAAVRDSVLLPFLWRHLCSAAFTEMTTRSAFYTTALRIVQELCRPATGCLLLEPATAGEGDGGAVAAAVRGMASAARHYSVAIRKTVLPAGADASGSGAGGSCARGGSGSGAPALTVSARAAAAGAFVTRDGIPLWCRNLAKESGCPFAMHAWPWQPRHERAPALTAHPLRTTPTPNPTCSRGGGARGQGGPGHGRPCGGHRPAPGAAGGRAATGGPPACAPAGRAAARRRRRRGLCGRGRGGQEASSGRCARHFARPAAAAADARGGGGS